MTDIDPTAAESAVRLRQMADLQERHAGILSPYHIRRNGWQLWYYPEREHWDSEPTEEAREVCARQMAEHARTLRHDPLAMGAGTTEKEADEHTFTLKVTVGLVEIRLSTSRESVCSPRVVGTKQVEEIDYSNAPRHMVTKEVVEWECAPILAREAQDIGERNAQ